MSNKSPRIRSIRFNLRLTMIIVGFFFCVIIVKLGYVSLSNNVDGIDLTSFANSRNTTKETLFASRGIIYDVNGKALAKNANSYKIIAILSPSRTTDEKNPKHVVDKDNTANKLCEVLARKDDEKAKCVKDILSYLELDRYQVELGVWGHIGEDERQEILKLDLPGIEFEPQSKKRQYLNSSWASYILGYARSNDDGEIEGEMGIEAYYDDILKGSNGYREYQQDAYGYKMAIANEIVEEAVPGNNVYLTIDSDVQNVLENAITNFSKDKSLDWALFTIMDAKTGAIVGSATNPNFNPNTLDNLKSYMNPLVSYQYEPGSTMKIFSWLAAMENGIYKGDELYPSGTIKLSDNTLIKDFNNIGWGNISYDRGFAYSSNVAATRLALELGVGKLNDYYLKCGFSTKTKITLPGEEAGLIDINYESELANASFGQGILVTPVQLMRAMSAFANDGVMASPYVVSKITDSTGKVLSETEPVYSEKIASSENIKKMKKLLYNVVYDSFSYNKLYAPSNVTIAGKTGTAQIASPRGGYLTGEYDYIKSFLGIFPYEDPQYVFYFATKQFVGPSGDIYTTISNTIKDVANIVNVTEEKNDVDDDKIIVLDDYMNKNKDEVVKSLSDKHLSVITFGEGNTIINQYPLANAKVISGSKVFFKTNENSFLMPDVLGWSENEIRRLCEFIGLKYHIEGYGKVKKVSIPAKTELDISNMVLEVQLEP